MEERARTQKEYGGFLPLELNSEEEYFAKYEPYLYRFNSVKAGLAFLIDSLCIRKLYIPYYYCPSTSDAIKKLGLELNYYHIDNNFLPESIEDEPDSAILLVNYFGICSENLRKIILTIHKAKIVLDMAHDFYFTPDLDTKLLYYVYSARKFFGVPDGAYVVGKGLPDSDMTLSSSYKYADYLLNAYENGTNVAYAEKKQADEIISNSYESMSKLSLGLLKNVNYDRVRRIRENNYSVYLDLLEEFNELKLPPRTCPYMFPLLISRFGRIIKLRLVQEKIYVPTLWNGKNLIEKGNDFELSMMNDCVFLPVDQRYEREDLEFIVSKIRRIISENT